MTKKHKDICNAWEKAAGFEMFGKEDIRSDKSCRQVLRRNQKWLEDHLTDTIQRASSVIAHAELEE